MRSASALSAGWPVMVIWLPRTCTSLATDRSTSRSSSSPAPSNLTITCGSSTVILVCTCTGAGWEPVFAGGSVSVMGGPLGLALLLLAAC
jgi:hypothetical protein